MGIFVLCVLILGMAEGFIKMGVSLGNPDYRYKISPVVALIDSVICASCAVWVWSVL